MISSHLKAFTISQMPLLKCKYSGYLLFFGWYTERSVSLFTVLFASFQSNHFLHNYNRSIYISEKDTSELSSLGISLCHSVSQIMFHFITVSVTYAVFKKRKEIIANKVGIHILQDL